MPVSASATITRQPGKRLTCSAITRPAQNLGLTAVAIATATLVKSVALTRTAVTPPAAFVLKAAGRIYKPTATALATLSNPRPPRGWLPPPGAPPPPGGGRFLEGVPPTASVVLAPSVVKEAGRTFLTGATIPLPPVFGSATPQAVLTNIFQQGRIFTTSVGTNAAMVKFMVVNLTPNAVTSTATFQQITALSVKVLVTTVSVAATVAEEMVQTARNASVISVASIQKTFNLVQSITLSASVAVGAFLAVLFGEDAPIVPRQAGLVLTHVGKGALTLASSAKRMLTRRDI